MSESNKKAPTSNYVEDASRPKEDEKKDNKQNTFDFLDDENLWNDMPEYNNKKKEISNVIIRFETEEDIADFAQLIGQTITKRTKSLFHPKVSGGTLPRHRYVDEDSDDAKVEATDDEE